MGYQYDWTTRVYHEGAQSPVPQLLKELATLFGRTSLTLSSECCSTNFTPSACIVNYYKVKSVMGGHRDDLELALDKPVVSISLGLPAVFLLGGKKKTDEPVIPILVRPGDVMILSGDSRMNYHGMARVLPADVGLPAVPENLAVRKSFQLTSQSVLSAIDRGDEPFTDVTVRQSDRIALADYLRDNRINVNIRQVLPDHMEKLPEIAPTHTEHLE
jgi:alkylated DNA repair protein alkB family protein 1